MRQWLVQLTAGFLGRCGLDYHEADDLVDFAEHMSVCRQKEPRNQIHNA